MGEIKVSQKGMKSAQKTFERNCLICDSVFEYIALREGKAKYCSRSCYYKAMHLNGRNKRECVFCHETFSAKKSDPKKYCSHICHGLDARLIPDQLTNVRNWFKKGKLLKKCERCNYSESECVLGVHHINKNHHDNRFENLIVLCANCHSIEHGRHIVHGSR